MEYEDALKVSRVHVLTSDEVSRPDAFTLCFISQSAARQGNRLHMNVYETRGQPARVSTATKTGGAEPKRGFRPPQHCPALAQVVSRKVQAAVPEQGVVRNQLRLYLMFTVKRDSMK